MLLSVSTKNARCWKEKTRPFLRTFQVDLLVHYKENGCYKIVYTPKFTRKCHLKLQIRIKILSVFTFHICQPYWQSCLSRDIKGLTGPPFIFLACCPFVPPFSSVCCAIQQPLYSIFTLTANLRRPLWVNKWFQSYLVLHNEQLAIRVEAVPSKNIPKYTSIQFKINHPLVYKRRLYDLIRQS